VLWVAPKKSKDKHFVPAHKKVTEGVVMNSQKKIEQEALETVIVELERNLEVLELNYRKAVTNLKSLRERVETDDLTKLMRRGAFMRKLGDLLIDSKETGDEVQLMMIDIDHFKAVNDNYGHQTGDVVLTRVAELVRQYLRTEDLAGRYGGEEIIVAMQVSSGEAQRIAENIRAAVQAQLQVSSARRQDAERAEAKTFHVTLSMGIASTQDFTYEADVLIGEADAALYRAKRGGRNKVLRAKNIKALSIAELVLEKAAA